MNAQRDEEKGCSGRLERVSRGRRQLRRQRATAGESPSWREIQGHARALRETALRAVAARHELWCLRAHAANPTTVSVPMPRRISRLLRPDDAVASSPLFESTDDVHHKTVSGSSTLRSDPRVNKLVANTLRTSRGRFTYLKTS